VSEFDHEGRRDPGGPGRGAGRGADDGCIRRAVVAANHYGPHDVPELRMRMNLIGNVPALQSSAALHYDEWERAISDFAATRTGQPADSLYPLAVGRATPGRLPRGLRPLVRPRRRRPDLLPGRRPGPPWPAGFDPGHDPGQRPGARRAGSPRRVNHASNTAAPPSPAPGVNSMRVAFYRSSGVERTLTDSELVLPRRRPPCAAGLAVLPQRVFSKVTHPSNSSLATSQQLP